MRFCPQIFSISCRKELLKKSIHRQHQILLLIIISIVSYRIPLDASSTFDRRLTQSESIWPLSEPTFSGRAAVSLCMHSILTPRRHRSTTQQLPNSSRYSSSAKAYYCLYYSIHRLLQRSLSYKKTSFPGY